MLSFFLYSYYSIELIVVRPIWNKSLICGLLSSMLWAAESSDRLNYRKMANLCWRSGGISYNTLCISPLKAVSNPPVEFTRDIFVIKDLTWNESNVVVGYWYTYSHISLRGILWNIYLIQCPSQTLWCNDTTICPNARGRVRNKEVKSGIWRTIRASPSALGQQSPTNRS